ncbi:sortase [Spongisporangium articulatum]|uniref:Sortase n=1 Tax=Spongisporangium articulatum TaxID=3362603 RepID=A0ABW8AGM3_9ACTN
MTVVVERSATTVARPRTAARVAVTTRLGYGDVAGTALVILGILMFTFVATLSGLGTVKHVRDQQVAYDAFRSALANATAPVGQLGSDGKPLKLGTPVATLTIPQIGVNEIVFEGTTSGVLQSGPGHRRDTALPGQAGIALIYARHGAFGAPFAHLDQLRRGAVLQVTTGQGRHSYRVIAVRRAGDPMPAAPAAGTGRLRLVTATGPMFVPEGLLYVDAQLVSKVQENPLRPITTSSLPEAEKPLQSDDSAWVPILLLAQGLLLAALLLTWLRTRWGAAQVWLVGLPAVLALAVGLSQQVARLLPNLM